MASFRGPNSLTTKIAGVNVVINSVPGQDRKSTRAIIRGDNSNQGTGAKIQAKIDKDHSMGESVKGRE